MRQFEDYCWKDITPADVLTIYSAYRRNRGVPRGPALLILHPKTGIEITAQPDWQTAAVQLIERACALSVPVLHSMPPGAAPAKLVAPRPDESIIPRPRDSAFMFFRSRGCPYQPRHLWIDRVRRQHERSRTRHCRRSQVIRLQGRHSGGSDWGRGVASSQDGAVRYRAQICRRDVSRRDAGTDGRASLVVLMEEPRRSVML